ncbi:MAG: LPS export ABC transporter ATP-binding protein [Planctomycetes bacterium]|nr:LPS export ABC transporter ATP-binding protein [Planctomycetota bacterium]MCB9919576.1 LPS export ABC transporter ATP-binding protein [Planctomycetota bacterium]
MATTKRPAVETSNRVTNDDEPLLEAVDLVKAYKRRRVVDGVCLEVWPGEIVGLLGANGAGKTTTFRMLVGMIRPDAGQVFFEGRDITKRPMYRRARAGIGYLSQEPSVFQKMTVEDNLLAVLEAHGVPSRARGDRLEELLDELDLGRLRKSMAYTLSGGERRRLEITRGLATNPTLILLDEPFAGVDPISVQDVQHILERLRDRGIGVLLTDHHVHETLRITERSYIVHEGRVLAEGAPADLIRNEEVKRAYLGDSFEPIPGLDGRLGGALRDGLDEREGAALGGLLEDPTPEDFATDAFADDEND